VIGRIDMVYGLSALMVILTGSIRFFYLEKGYAYYLDNYLFVTKLILVLTVGLLSIYPTIIFIKWRKELEEKSQISLDHKLYSNLKRIIRIEVFIVALVPLLAAMAARGDRLHRGN